MNDTPDTNEDTSVPTDRRPLGYWLRLVDGLLTREFAATLEDEGLSRRDWMLLNVLSGDVDDPELRDRLARRGKRLRGLEDRGWVVQQGDGTWALTDVGRAEKERVGGIVDGIRSRVIAAAGPEGYAVMTASLESIARELGWDESSPASGPFPGFGRGFGPGFAPGFGRAFVPGVGPGPGSGFGFGGRPRPFDSEIRDGIGRNRHRGFAPGRPGHPAERFDEPFSDSAAHADGCHDHHGQGHHGAHGADGHQAHGHHGDAAHHHGHHGKGHHGGRGRRVQEAYERGFDAGFARGRESQVD